MDVTINNGGTVHQETISLIRQSRFLDMNEKTTRCWIEYPRQNQEHTARIVLSGASPKVGIVRAANVKESWENPEYGIGNTPENYSVEIDLDNGFTFLRGRNEKGSFPGCLKIHDDEEQARAFLELGREIGVQPFACLLADGMQYPENWIVFGVFPPKSRPHGKPPKHGTWIINFEIKEHF